MKNEGTRHVTLEKYPGCNNMLKPSDNFYSQCSLVLNQIIIKEIEVKSKQVPAALTLLNADPDMQAKTAEKLSVIFPSISS